MFTSMMPLFVILLACILIITTNAGSSSREWPPKVMVVILVRNKAHLLNNTLKLLENQDYPKHRIGLFIRSDHNEDNTEDILETWLESQMEEYHFKDVSIGKNFGERFQDQKLGPMEWSPSRFNHMIALKEEALIKARKLWADWIWYLDADAFIINPSTLRHLVQDNQKTIVAPMLTSVGLYSNFWAGMSESYYYQRTEDYKPILNRKKQGCHSVPMVHSSILINMNNIESQKLSFDPKKIDSYDGVPYDDIISFALSAADNDIDLYICNDLNYGYIMLPLEDDQNLNQDLDNLVNLKTEIFAYGHRLPSTSVHSEYRGKNNNNNNWDLLGSDKVYLINLERRPDRLSNMESIFKELQIKFTKIPAVDGKTDVTEKYLEYHGIKMMSDFSEPYHQRPLTLGEIGCFMSHYNIWKDMLEQNLNEIVVFEDDVRFEPFFKQKLTSVREELEHMEWDLVFLGRKILANYEENWVDKSDWLVHVNYTYWTLGYMLKHSGAKKLVEEKPLGKMVPVDEYLPIMYDKHPNETWKKHYFNRNLIAFSVHPLLLFPTHYTGEEGYISDTEDTNILHDEL